jgi:drug/metabolite transporter (DMT)-like permease
MLFEVVVASVSSLLLTAERPRAIEWCGGALVMLAAYIAIAHPPAHKPSDCAP